MTKAAVNGFADERFAAVREAFAGLLASGDDVGAAFAATVEGETVVDLWGGFADEARTRPWEKDTLVNVYSTTKTMCALTALLVADRGAVLIPPPPGGAIGDGEQSELTRNMSSNPGVDVMATRTRAWRAAEIPAANGHGNARSIAEIHVLLANGGVAKGKRILSEAGCRKALEPQVEGRDLVLGMPARFGLGFGLPGATLPLQNPNSLFWGGYGGSLAIIDMDARTTFAYAMNRMAPTTTGDMRAFILAMGMWEGLESRG